MSKNKIKEKNQLYKRIKKIQGENKKNLIRGQTKVFNWRIKSNWKITLTKWKTNQKNESRIGKKKQQKLWLIDEIES